ncbi:MAG: hypothetical protein ABIH08_08015 [Candidatus Omnitrophota bacterium]
MPLRNGSGTRKDYKKKIEKLEKTVKYILDKHINKDKSDISGISVKDEKKHIENIRKKISKIKRFLAVTEDKSCSFRTLYPFLAENFQ